jgi:parvulin-like peptidyl-prolyl isomerase
LDKAKNVEKAPRVMTHRQLSRHQKQQRRHRIVFFSGIAVIVVVILVILGGWYNTEYAPLRQTILQVYDTKFDTSFLIDTLVIFGQSQGSTDLSSIFDTSVSQIAQDEVIKQEAGKLGISVSDADAIQLLQSIDIPVNNAAIELARGYLLSSKVKSDYFSTQVVTSDNQVWVRAMMVESETVAQQIRENIVNGENFSELDEQFDLDLNSTRISGDFGWHPLVILRDELSSLIPLDYASRDDAKAGDLSQPLADNLTSKKLGYWLIRINDMPNPDSANVSAILLSNWEEALAIRARLVAGEALGPIAEQYSHYGSSSEGPGQLGLILNSDSISQAFNGYVFSQVAETGQWSEPIREDSLYTPGGFWLVQVVDREENRELSSDDRDTLIDRLFSNWMFDANNASSNFTINSLTDNTKQIAIQRATEILLSGQK